jgi:HEAT repeat protein
MLRATAASALGAAGGPEAVEPLIGALADPEDLVRSYGIDSLEILGDPRAAEALIAVAKDTSTERSLRWHAVRSLGKVGGEEAYRYLVGLLKHTDGHLRRSAAKALGHMMDRRAVPQLIEVLGQVSPKRTHSAAWWQAMQVDNRFLLVDVRGVEGAFSPFGGGSMRMYHIDDYAMARWNAADALGKIGDRRAVMPLIAMLDEEDEHAWYWAALALGELGDERAVPHLLAKLEDRNLSDRPRMVIAEALGKIGHPSAAPGLRGLLAGGRNSKRSKAWILWSLWKAGDAEVVGRCLQGARDKDAEVRWAAVRALGLIGSRKALAPVLARLEDDDPDVRGVAARSLGLIGDPSAVDALISAVGDRERIVQFWAIVASGRLGDQRAVPALERALQGTSWPYAALWALQRMEARSQERTRVER